MFLGCGAFPFWNKEVYACTGFLKLSGCGNYFFYSRGMIIKSQTFVENVFLIETINNLILFHNETVPGLCCNLFMTKIFTGIPPDQIHSS